MKTITAVSSDLLRLDPELETQRITSWIRQTVFHTLRRKGAVIAVSGGIDSSVVAFLCAQALGHDRIQLLFMPEADSSPNSLQLEPHGCRQAQRQIGTRKTSVRFSPVRGATSDEMIRSAWWFLNTAPKHKCKIVLPGLLDAGRYAIFFPSLFSRPMVRL